VPAVERLEDRDEMSKNSIRTTRGFYKIFARLIRCFEKTAKDYELWNLGRSLAESFSNAS
jgi:hypothetical protein